MPALELAIAWNYAEKSFQQFSVIVFLMQILYPKPQGHSQIFNCVERGHPPFQFSVISGS